MEQIKILFFVIGSFFGMEDARIAADKTTVTIDPISRQIEIIQEDLFAVIQSESDTTLVMQQWKFINQPNVPKEAWAKDLDSLSLNDFSLKSSEKSIRPHMIFNYNKPSDLRVMGVWYDAAKNQFSINEIPRQNIKTKQGELAGNYWIFDDASPFSFTLEPFKDIPQEYQKQKVPIVRLLGIKE